MAVVLTTVTLIPAQAQRPTPVPHDAPRMAGTTRIHAQKTGGTYLRADLAGNFPEPNSPQPGISIEPGAASAVFVGIASDSSRCYDPAEPHFCMETWWFWVPEIPQGFGIWQGKVHPEWPMEVYIVTDAPVTVTLHLVDVPGETTIVADQPVRGWLDHLPATCPAGSLPCERFAFGGKTRGVGESGFTASIAYAAHDQRKLVDETPTTNPVYSFAVAGAWGCLHPHSGLEPNASSDPADYPLGCDSTAWNHVAVTTNFILFSLVGNYRVAGWVDYGASGPVYAGFRTSRASALGEAYSGAIGLWVSRGFGPWEKS